MHQVLPRQTSRSAPKAASTRPPSGLPEPAERRRLRERWGLTTQQVSIAFGVTPATVRSWESGRTLPRGQRHEAYRLFLAGLAQTGTTDPAAKPERNPVPVRRAAPAVRRPEQGPGTAPLTPPREARSSQPHRTGATEPPPTPEAPVAESRSPRSGSAGSDCWARQPASGPWPCGWSSPAHPLCNRRRPCPRPITHRGCAAAAPAAAARTDRATSRTGSAWSNARSRPQARNSGRSSSK